MKALAVVVGIAVVGALFWSGCRESRSRAEWVRDTTRVFQGVQAREDSAHQMLTEGLRLIAKAHADSARADQRFRRGETAYRSALNYRDSLDALLTALPDTPQIAHVALRALDSLGSAYQSLKEAFDLQGQALAEMDSAYWSQAKRAELYRESVDSLSALVRRFPNECRIGPIPCPSLTVGYGVVENDGFRTGLGATFGWSIPLGKR